MALLDPSQLLSPNIKQAGQNIGIGQQMPNASPAELNPATAQLMATQNQRAGMSDQALAAETMRGTAGAGNVTNTDPAMAQQNSALGMASNPDLSAALQARSQRYLDAGLAGLQNEALLNAPSQKLQMMRAAAGSAEAQSAIKFQNYQRNWQSQANVVAARNKVISGLLGTAGTVGGMAVGGPAGAQAGGMAGGVAGGSLGPTQTSNIGEGS